MTNNVELEENIQLLFDEADTNYQTGRYQNAAKGFEYLSRQMLDNHMHEEMIYFFYRSICSWRQVDRVDEMVKNYHQLGLNAMKLGTMVGIDKLTKPIPVKEKAEILWYTHLNLKLLGEEEKQKKVSLLMVEMNKGLIKDEFIEADEKKKYLIRNLGIFQELQFMDKYRDTCNQFAELLAQEGDLLKESGGYSNDYIIADQYGEASKYFEKAGKQEKAEEMRNLAINMAPDINLKKYYPLDKEQEIVNTN